MKTLARILFALVIGLLGCNRASNGANKKVGDPRLTDTGARDAAEIKTVEERFTTAFRAKDVNAIMQLCVPDDSLHIFDVQPPREVKGRAAYRKDWEDAFNSVSGPLEVENSDMDVTSGGDIAYVHYINHVVGTMKDGKKVEFHGSGHRLLEEDQRRVAHSTFARFRSGRYADRGSGSAI